MDVHTDSDRMLLTDMFQSLTSSTEGNLEVYEQHATHYDVAFAANGCTLANQLAAFCLQNCNGSGEELQALDVCSGTGLSGIGLRAAGWKGAIDGLDGCQAMIDVAKSKDVYRKIYFHQIFKDSPMPVTSSSYDVIMCSGGLSFGHLPHDCLTDIVDLVKPGGIFVFNTGKFRGTDPNGLNDDAVTNQMKSLSNKCKLVDQKVTQTWSSDIKFHMVDHVILHCYKKT